MLGAYEGVDKWTLTRRISAGISSPENKQVRSGELSRMTLVVACRMSQFKAQIAYLGMSLLLLQRKGFLVVFHGPSLLVDRIGELLSSNVARSECPRRYIDVAVPADFRLDKHLLAVGVILTNADPSRQNHRDDLGQVIIVALPSFVSGQARPPHRHLRASPAANWPAEDWRVSNPCNWLSAPAAPRTEGQPSVPPEACPTFWRGKLLLVQ